jgi:PAS domain S-box-containing protein
MQHPVERSEKKRFLSDLFNRPESLPLLLFILFFVILDAAGPELRSAEYVFDPPGLLFALNTVFITGLNLLIAWLCFRSYLRGGFLNVLLLGCGVLALGLTSFAAAWLIRPPYGLNEAVTIRNLGVLCTAAFFFLSSLFTAFGISMEIEHRRGLIAVMAYTGIFTMGAILTAATLLHYTPPFFIAAEGPTIIRQVVLAVSVTLLATSALLLMTLYSERKSGFLLYSVNALLLVGAGIVGVSLGVPGSPLSWLGRAAQYMGNVYLVVASMQALGEARNKGTTIEKALADFFRKSETHYRALIDMAADAIIAIDRKGKIILMNPAAEETLGYSRDEAAGQSLTEQIVPGQSRELFHACLYGEPCRNIGVDLKRKDGSIFPAELSFSPELKSDGGSERTIIIRDVTERRQAEEAVRSAALFPIQNPEPILRIHRDGTLLFSNPAAGPVLAEWRTAPENLFPDWVRQAVEAALNEGAPRALEIRIAGRDFSFVVTPIVEGQYANLYGWDVTDRKRAEEALRENEERYRGLFESMNEGFALHELICDEKGEPSDYRFLDVNPAFERQTGLKRQDVVGRTVIEVLPDIEPLWIKRYGDVALTGTPAHFESHTSALGRDYEVFAYRPAPGQFAAIFLDITERKQAEAALRKSEARLRLAHDAGKVGTWEWNLSTNENIWSEELWKLYGLDPHDCKPDYEKWRQTIHPDDRARTEQIVQEAVTHGAELNAEWRVRDRDGSIRWLMSRGQPQVDVKGRPMRYIGIVVDITGRKRAEEALRGSEARYRSYTEVTGQMGWTTNADGEIVEDVPAFQQYTGQTFNEMQGWGWSTALHPDDLEITLAVWRKAVEEKQGYETEYRLRRHDGVYRYFLARGVPILNDDGSVREWVGTCIDITERRKQEEELRKLNRTLRALSRSNEALMRADADEESAFLEEVCRIVVQDCGHAMVWIGLAADDEDKTVRPVAHAGFAEGYLETLNLTWADRVRGRGPTGTAIRTGKPILCADMLTDPQFEPWRDEALNRGYASSLALPLLNAGRAFGAVTIYSTQPDSFSEEEIKLLSEMADDLTYGIASLRLRLQSRQVLQALRESEARFRQLADSMPQLVWTAEPGGRVDYFNRRLSSFTTRGPWRPAVYAEDRPRTVEAWKSAVRSGSPYEIEHRLQLADGRFRWFLTRAVPVPDETGQVMKWYGTSTDVDDRRRVEEEREIARIEATTEKIRIEALMEALPVGVALVDESGGNVQSNIMYDQIWGEPRPEARSVDDYGKYKAWWIDSGRQVQPDEWASARAVKKGESVTGQMMRIERFDGTTAFVMNSAVPIHDVDGKITGSAVVILDITERIEIEQALKQAKDELEDKVRERTAELILLLEDLEKSRDDLRKLASELVLAEERERKKISVTLHDEVAQTLAAARMRIDLLRSKPGDDESRRAIDEAQQLLVQAIRETRALMTDVSNPVLYDMGLRVAVQSLTEEVTARKGISVSCSFDGRLTNLAQDLEVMIFQLVKELVQNIVKHSGARKASIRIVEERDDINVVVADDGLGFDVGNIGSVGVDGGFGLFSIRERVKSYHGKIKIESEPGKGSEVTVMLPKKAAGVAASRKTGKRK